MKKFIGNKCGEKWLEKSRETFVSEVGAYIAFRETISSL